MLSIKKLRKLYSYEIRTNPSLKDSPIYVLASSSHYMSDLLMSEMFSGRKGGEIIDLISRSQRQQTLVSPKETYKPENSTFYADYLVRKVTEAYNFEDHGADTLYNIFRRIREIRGGDRDVPTALVYYYGMGVYWLWIYNPQRRQPNGEFTTWGNVVYHFINPWKSTILPESESRNLRTECRSTLGYLERERKYRSPASLDLIAFDEIDFLRSDTHSLRQAIVKAHDSESETYIREVLTPIVRGTEAETRYLFWRNEYYPRPPELSMVWNIRRYPLQLNVAT
jgi:hypothetical protein